MEAGENRPIRPQTVVQGTPGMTKYHDYAFRTEHGRVFWVDFATMMTQDVAGYIRLPDGTEARRCRSMEGKTPRKLQGAKRAVPAPSVSDSLGFPAQALSDRRAQLQASGCLGIEFKPDPGCPDFYQVHASSEKAMARYAKARNMVNRTGALGGKVMLSQADLDRAAVLVGRS